MNLQYHYYAIVENATLSKITITDFHSTVNNNGR